MNNTTRVNVMETRKRNNQAIFFKSQEEFATALSEETNSVEEIVLTDELIEGK